MKSLRIKNFKCFLDKEIEFSNLTVLAGENGAGKSTVIQTFLLLLQSFNRNDFTNLPKKLYINDYYCELGSAENLLNNNAGNDLIEFIFKDKNDNCVEFVLAEDKEDANVLQILNIDDITLALKNGDNHAISFIAFFDFIGADRLGPKSFHHTDSNFSRINVGKFGEYTALILEKHKLEHLLYDKFDLLDAVNYWLSEIFGYVNVETSLIKEVNVAMIKIQNRKDGNPENPMNMPYGISYVLPIIVSCLVRLIPKERLFEDYRSRVEENEIVIIENPEAHLHPKAQSKLGYFLAHMSNYMQIVVETHSEHIINGIRLATLEDTVDQKNICINFFESDEDTFEPNIIKIQIDEMSDLSDWPKGFFDQQELDITTIIRARMAKSANR